MKTCSKCKQQLSPTRKHAYCHKCMSSYGKKYREKYKKEISQRMKRYREENKEVICLQRSRYYQANIEQEQERKRKYHQNNPQASFNSSVRRRHRTKDLVPIDKTTWLFIMHRDRFTCQYCGTRLTKETRTLDHVQPVSKGGSNEVGNLQASCRSCNSKKGIRSPAESIPEMLPAS